MSTAVSRLALLDTIPVGADHFSQRVGRKIRVKRIVFRGLMLGGQTNSVADDPFDTMRVVVVRCLPSTTSLSLSTHNMLDPRFSTNAGLLDVLYDRTVVIRVNAKDSTGYIPSAKYWQFSLDCDIPVCYGGTAAAAPVDQTIALFAVSDSAAVVNPGFSTDSVYCVEYTDDI